MRSGRVNVNAYEPTIRARIVSCLEQRAVVENAYYCLRIGMYALGCRSSMRRARSTTAREMQRWRMRRMGGACRNISYSKINKYFSEYSVW